MIGDVVETIEADPDTGHPWVYLKDITEIENVGIDHLFKLATFCTNNSVIQKILH
jgi:hypothetical protein